MATKKNLLDAAPAETKNPKITKLSAAKTSLSMIKPNANTSEGQLQPQKSPCCMGNTPCSSTTQSTLLKPGTSTLGPMDSKKGPKTRITIKYDVGFGNSLSLRGKGANLNWERGVSLKNVKPDEWVWETEASFTTCEFKVLINDRHYETGNNHTLKCGDSIQYTPRF